MRKRDWVLKNLGMIPKCQFELPSSGKEKTFSLDIPASDEAWPSRLTLFLNDELLAISDSEFQRRGIYLSWSTLGSLIFVFCFFLFCSMPFFFPLAPYWIIPFIGLVTLPSAAGFIWLAKQEIKGYAIYPVIFNRRTGNVHFFSIHNGQPVSYSWRQCIYCIVPKRSGGPEGRDYELRGYVLNDRHGGVMDSFSIGEESVNLGNVTEGFMNRWLSCQFEYVRAFMASENVDDLTVPRKKDFISLKPNFKQSMHIVNPKEDMESTLIGALSFFIYVLLFIPKLVEASGHYLCCKYCKVPQWSDEIIEECGPEIVLSNR